MKILLIIPAYNEEASMDKADLSDEGFAISEDLRAI